MTGLFLSTLPAAVTPSPSGMSIKPAYPCLRDVFDSGDRNIFVPLDARQHQALGGELNKDCIQQRRDVEFGGGRRRVKSSNAGVAIQNCIAFLMQGEASGDSILECQLILWNGPAMIAEAVQVNNHYLTVQIYSQLGNPGTTVASCRLGTKKAIPASIKCSPISGAGGFDPLSFGLCALSFF